MICSADQLLLDLFRTSPDQCEHESCYMTMMYVPPGIYCTRCKLLISQFYIAPNEPEIIGYVSASWAWHYRDGKSWTTQNSAHQSRAVASRTACVGSAKEGG